MKISGLTLSLLLLTPLLAHAAPQDMMVPQSQPFDSSQSSLNNQSDQTSQNQATPDVFSYSYVQINRLSENSDYFNSRSAGQGLKISYGFDSGVYVFGHWNRLNFDSLSGQHTLSGIGIGAHQEYNASTSFYIDLSFLHDQLSGNLGSAADNYWRVSYGFHSHLSSFVALTGAIFTERNTDFGRRPFGERLGLSFGSRIVALAFDGEHTADGNRLEATLTWYYK